MALRSDDLQASHGSRLVIQLDIRTTARHVGGDGDRAVHAGVRHDLRFQLMELGVQHLMRNALLSQKMCIRDSLFYFTL